MTHNRTLFFSLPGTLALSVFYMLGQRVYYKYVIKQPFPGSQTYK